MFISNCFSPKDDLFTANFTKVTNDFASLG